MECVAAQSGIIATLVERIAALETTLDNATYSETGHTHDDAGSSIPANAVMMFAQNYSENETNPCPTGWSFLQEATRRMPIGAGQPLGKLSAEFSNTFGKYEIYDPKTGEMTQADLRPHRQDANGNWLYYTLMETGGVETLITRPEQMPRHKHDVLWRDQHSVSLNNTAGDVANDNQYRLDWSDNLELGRAGDNLSATWQGGSEPQTNMPPYIALYFCKKE